jgi:hypothetical protein
LPTSVYGGWTNNTTDRVFGISAIQTNAASGPAFSAFQMAINSRAPNLSLILDTNGIVRAQFGISTYASISPSNTWTTAWTTATNAIWNNPGAFVYGVNSNGAALWTIQATAATTFVPVAHTP